MIFMPVSNQYNKKGLASNEDRYHMLRLICDPNPKFEVSRIEIDSERQLYTIETLEILGKKYPEYSLWFIIGTDNLKELKTWKNPEELMSKYKILVLKRKEDNIDEIIENDLLLKKYKESFIKINNKTIDISSSEIREKMKKGESVANKIEDKVYTYIKEKKIYT